MRTHTFFATLCVAAPSVSAVRLGDIDVDDNDDWAYGIKWNTEGIAYETLLQIHEDSDSNSTDSFMLGVSPGDDDLPHQWQKDYVRKLPPYNKPESSFAGAYGAPKDSYWNAKAGDFGAPSDAAGAALRINDAYSAMFSLISDTYFGRSHGEIDILVRCRSRSRHYSVLPNGVKEICNGDQISEAHAEELNSSGWIRQQGTLRGLATSKKSYKELAEALTQKAQGACKNMQYECTFQSIKFLADTLKVLGQLASKFAVDTEPAALAIQDAQKWTKNWKEFKANSKQPIQKVYGVPRGHREPRLLYTPLMQIRAIFDEFLWSNDVSKHFYNDDGGKRQGMWTMLHMLTVNMPNLPIEFYKLFVMHWNPCPTCRRRYYLDMAAIWSAVEQAEKLRDLPAKWTSALAMWVYHTEVSMRVQAGLKRDVAIAADGREVKDWTANPTWGDMAKKFSRDWEKDKRWPNKDMCTDCWKSEEGQCKDFNEKTQGGEAQFDTAAFLSCWDLTKVYEYLVKTYSRLTPGKKKANQGAGEDVPTADDSVEDMTDDVPAPDDDTQMSGTDDDSQTPGSRGEGPGGNKKGKKRLGPSLSGTPPKAPAGDDSPPTGPAGDDGDVGDEDEGASMTDKKRRTTPV
eukprot:TRINITY_DN92497_c0_g1_i1.p1 TRINITY_DN92497_c0_g1~~TRINITY_DN92497_c0_g1_i1.p1  ORF type:complete len:628 (-),score=111.29 TRINITY_DN92497_c0_g1_i1:145-2028(-)